MYIFRSAGINKFLSERHGGLHLKEYMLEVADKIFCMEEVHANYIAEKINSKYLSKVEILKIGDVDNFMSNSLKRELLKKVKL